MTLTDAELDNLFERSKRDDMIIVGSEIRQLVAEIRHHRRIDRVDNSIARRLGKMMEHDAHVRIALDQWLAAYPLEQFPEPDMAKAHELLTAGGQTLDAISASNMRHVIKRVLEIMQEEEL